MNELLDYIDTCTAEGKRDARLIPWAVERGLFADDQYDNEASIQDSVTALKTRGWVWNHAAGQLERGGWKLWFRSQGKCGAPIAQWSNL